MEGEISFRIEVALRSVLVSEEKVLREFMEGRNDGEDQAAQVDDILRKILLEKIDVCERTLEMKKEDCIEGNLIRKLWEMELHISKVAQEVITIE
jgi:hypothetical protein